MSYQSWSVVFGEQPSAAKWNILGTNDSSFNDGTGITGLYKNLLTTDSNPYKFSVYRNSAQTINTGSFSKINFDTENFDTNNNWDNATNFNYTAPVAGFYHFSWSLAWGSTASLTRVLADIYKNGSDFARGTDEALGATTAGAIAGAITMQLSLSDTIDLRGQPVGANLPLSVGTAPQLCRFEGFLICRT